MGSVQLTRLVTKFLHDVAEAHSLFHNYVSTIHKIPYCHEIKRNLETELQVTIFLPAPHASVLIVPLPNLSI